MATCELWIVVDEDGDYAAADDRDAAEERYRDCIGSDAGKPLRVVCLKVNVPEPKPTHHSATLPASCDGEIVVTT